MKIPVSVIRIWSICVVPFSVGNVTLFSRTCRRENCVSISVTTRASPIFSPTENCPLARLPITHPKINVMAANSIQTTFFTSTSGLTCEGIFISRGDLFVGKPPNPGTVFRVFNRQRAEVPGLVEVEQRVLVEVTGFRNRAGPQLDVQCVRVFKVFHFHNSNERSKNAL